MAPYKCANQNKPCKKAVSENNFINTNTYELDEKSKRKANSPPKIDKDMKRSAFGDITNAFTNSTVVNEKNARNIEQQAETIPYKSRHQTQKSSQLKVKPKAVEAKSTNAKQVQKCSKVPVIILDRTLPDRRNLVGKTSDMKAPVVKINRIKCEKLKQPENSGCEKPETVDTVDISKPNVENTECSDLKFKVSLTVDLTKNCMSSLQKPNSSDARKKSSITPTDDSHEGSSLYVSAVEELSDKQSSTRRSSGKTKAKHSQLPQGVDDYDKECQSDPCQASQYAMDIFSYMKEREAKFKIDSYMEKQDSVNAQMRAVLVNWLVDVQENFELNHETLYLGVKLTDLYLSKVNVPKETLQLVGVTAMLIASKYDERQPPIVDDFLYLCDGAYTHGEMIRMEMAILKAVDFELGIPLSYRFLRRYARVSRLAMPELTFARYILELSLTDYNLITESESKLAAAALFIALKTKFISGWTPTLEYYTGYKIDDIRALAITLNQILHTQQNYASVIKAKYSHRVFFEVSNIPLIENTVLQE